jgi:hypothetical protein
MKNVFDKNEVIYNIIACLLFVLFLFFCFFFLLILHQERLRALWASPLEPSGAALAAKPSNSSDIWLTAEQQQQQAAYPFAGSSSFGRPLGQSSFADPPPFVGGPPLHQENLSVPQSALNPSIEAVFGHSFSVTPPAFSGTGHNTGIAPAQSAFGHFSVTPSGHNNGMAPAQSTFLPPLASSASSISVSGPGPLLTGATPAAVNPFASVIRNNLSWDFEGIW